MPSLGPGWYAVQVRSQSEKMVVALLQHKGYELFLPTYRKSTSSRRNAEEYPLFPNYVFCRGAESASGLIVTTPGVVRILGYRNTPVSIPDPEIENLQLVLKTGLHIAPWPKFEMGMPVRLVDGPLKGCTGVVVNAHSETHLVVSVDLLQRSISVQMERNWVEAIHPIPRVVATVGHLT